MAEALVSNEAICTKIQKDDSLPLADLGILQVKYVMLVRDLDIEAVLAGLKPYLYYSQVDAINAETNRGSKTSKLIDTLKRLSVNNYVLFNSFLKIVGGIQPDLFSELVGRAPSEEEADFCVEKYAQTLRECVMKKGHSTDSPLDEEIEFDSEHVQLAIVQDKPETEPFNELPHRYQTYLSNVQDRKSTVFAVEILDSAQNEPKPKQILLYGRAGTGKTTTFQWLAREWSFNRWAPQFTLVFLLQLRMLSGFDRHMTAIELLTLAGLYQVTEAGLVVPLLLWLKHTAGRVLILIDGLDEVAGFVARLQTCPIISDLKQRAHPIDLTLNILQGNLLSGVTAVSASRPFAGLDALQFEKKFEILGLTESRVWEFIERKHPSKTADIMAVLTNSPLLMSVCSITFYCALISRLLADGVVFQQDELQTYSRLMAFLIVQCVERKLSEWCFHIEVSGYFHKLAHMGYLGVFDRPIKGEMTKLVFNESDIVQAGLTPQDLKSIQQASLLHIQKLKVGLRSCVSAEFFHFSVQEMLASAYMLLHFPLPGNIFSQLFSGGQFNMALQYLFGLHYDIDSEWVQTIRRSVNPSGQCFNSTAEQQMNDYIQTLVEKCDKGEGLTWQLRRGSTSQLQLCQLLHEGQMEDRARSIVRHIVPDGKLTIEHTQMTLIDLMAVWFVCKYAEAITEICLIGCGLTETLLRFLTTFFLKVGAEKLLVREFGDNKIGFDGVHAIAEWLQENHTLHTLGLYGNNIADNGAKAIAAVLQNNNSLDTLDVGGNNIGENGATAIAEALKNNNALHTLKIHNNNVGDNGATAIAVALQNNSTLQTLYIGNNNVGNDGATAIAGALQKNGTLQTLTVSNNNIGDNGATAIAGALQNNSTLHTLYVGGNNIGDNGATAIAEALWNNNTLHTLNVSNNNIGVNGSTAIAVSLLHNSSLHTLDISGNNIGDNGATALAASLQNSSTIRILTVYNNSIGENGFNALRGVRRHGLEIINSIFGELLQQTNTIKPRL